MKRTMQVLLATAALMLGSPMAQAQMTKAERIEQYRQICPPKFNPPSPIAVQNCAQLWAMISALPDDNDDDKAASPVPGAAFGPAPVGPDYPRMIRDNCNRTNLSLDQQRICDGWRARAGQAAGPSSNTRSTGGRQDGNSGQGSFEPVTSGDHPCVVCRQTIKPLTQQDAYHCENRCAARMSLRVCDENSSCSPRTLEPYSTEYVSYRKGGRWSHQVVGAGR